MDRKLYKPADVAVRELLEEQFNCDDEHCAMRILDCAVVGNHTAYAAVEWLMKDTGRRQVVGVVFRRTRSRNGSGKTICWQEMSESMLPKAFGCPERILRLLTPTDDPNALQWRETCRKQRCRGRLRTARAIAT